jgi:hypothetical protein
LSARRLLPQHERLLRQSAISREVESARNYWSATTGKELEALGFASAQRRVPALVIPIHDATGKLVLHQIRPDTPRIRRGKALKYETPAGERLTLDVPPTIRHQLGNPKEPLWITEGCRKADAAVSAGACCVSLLGVWSWRGTNSDGGKVAIAPLTEGIAWNGRRVYLAFDSDVARKPDVKRALDRLAAYLVARGADVLLVQLADVEGEAKVGLDDYLAAGGELADLQREAVRWQRRRDVAGPYSIEDGRMVWWKETKDGPVATSLSNFDARIAREVVRDDGAEKTMWFEVEATLASGRPLPRVLVGETQFAGLSWVLKLGSSAVVYAGMGTRDHLRAAIQMLSNDKVSATVYGHLGWRRIGDAWTYLHAGGAIGTRGPVASVEVDVPSALEHFELPPPPSGDALRAAVGTSLRLLSLGAPRVTVPVHAAIARSVLGGTDYTVHLSGLTGIFKSELAALAQQHYGRKLDRMHLAAWSSTGNSLEGIAFLAKDTLLVIDDFAPHGTASDVRRLHREADRLLRGQGNRSGRMRMCADSTLRPVKQPRGLILSTGEDVPAGQSLRARILTVEMKPGDIDASNLAEMQKLAADGVLAQALAGFVSWLAPQLEARQCEVEEKARAWRGRTFDHRRTADCLGSLAAGHACFTAFAVDVGALTQQKADEIAELVEAALLELGAEQAALHASEDPVRRFLELIASALVSGEAHLADADDPAEAPDDAERWGWRERRGDGPDASSRWVPLGARIGWVRGHHVYLESESTWKTVQRFADAQHQSLAIGERTLQKRLAERGLLVTRDPDHYTRKVSIGRIRPRVLHLRSAILTSTSGAFGAVGAEARVDTADASFGPENGPDPADRTIGAGNGAADAPEGSAGPSRPECPDSPDPGSRYVVQRETLDDAGFDL